MEVDCGRVNKEAGQVQKRPGLKTQPIRPLLTQIILKFLSSVRTTQWASMDESYLTTYHTVSPGRAQTQTMKGF
ncbi:hypothetical protein AOLI_G00313080 [Acnodon oligacanthus]